MISLLDRYVFRELAPPFLLGVALFTFFLTIDRIYHLTELIVTKGVPFHLVLLLLVYMLPSFLAHTFPMAFLVAVLLATGRLASDLEVVALKASGVSPLRLFRPFLAVALVVTSMTALLTLAVNPWANKAFKGQLFKILQTRAETAIKDRLFNTTFGRFVIYVEEVSPSQVALRGVIVADERDPKLSRIITARHGRLFTDQETRRTTLRLIDGAVHESDATSAARYRLTKFGLYDMNLLVTSPFESAPRIAKAEKDLDLFTLLTTGRELAQRGQNATPHFLEFHKRFAFPVAAIVFTMVGFPLGIRAHRGGRALALVASLVVVVTYYLLLTTLENAAMHRRIPPELAIWLPPALFTLVGVALLRLSARDIPTGWMKVFGYLRRRQAQPSQTPGDSVTRSRPTHRQGSRESTHLVDRYLLREFLTYAAYGVAIGSALFVVGDLLRSLDRYIRVKPPLVYILEYFAYRLPAALYEGLPLIVLIATIFLFLSLSRYHELTALKTAGMSLYRVALPILLLAFGLSAGSVVFQETLLPALRTKADEVDLIKIRGRLPRHLQRRTQLWYRSSDSRLFRMELLDPAGRQMDGVMILEIDRNFQVLNRLDAARAHWTPHGWEFERGMFREFGPGGSVEAIPFRLTSLELAETLETFTRSHQRPETMSFQQLRAYVTKLRESGHHVEKYLVQLYAKLSFPLIHVILVLVAIPFALRWPRGGRVIGIALAMVLTVGYWLVDSLAISFAKADVLPPLLAAWTANIVFAGLGVALFLRTRT